MENSDNVMSAKKKATDFLTNKIHDFNLIIVNFD